MKNCQTPELIDNYYFKRKGVTSIACGNNHFLVLSGSRVYSFGDKETGALGNVFSKERDRCDFSNPTSMNLRNIERIYCGEYCSYMLTHTGKKNNMKGSIYVCGLNNF